MSKIKKELKEFLTYKNNYKFIQKELIEIDDCIYCENELLKDKDGNKISETENWIDVGYRNRGDFPQMLSNLFPYNFKFRGKKLASIENFFQGIKFKDKKTQNYVFTYYGTQAVHIKAASSYDWKETGEIYWQGKAIKRESKEYELLIDELYISATQNPLYRNILSNCNKQIIHSIGENDKKETTFTRYEFEFELNCLKDFIQSKNKKEVEKYE
ncbi:MAG: hypothetical protein ACI4UU_05375 [Clostridia bacterium]